MVPTKKMPLKTIIIPSNRFEVNKLLATSLFTASKVINIFITQNVTSTNKPTKH